MSVDTSGVADRTSGDIIGVPCEREGLLCADIAGLIVGEEVASAEDGLWVAIDGSMKQVWVAIVGSTKQLPFDNFGLP